MKVLIEINASKLEAQSSARARQARNAGVGAALRLLADRIANAGTPEGETPFAIGEVKGTCRITGAEK